MEELNPGARLPTLFIGHGSPMIALQENEFTRRLKRLGQETPPPRAVLVISAHWLSQGGIYISSAKAPETIYDFGNFDERLFHIKYNCPGAPEFAALVKETLVAGGESAERVLLEERRGLDHGAWQILLHIFPEANLPVFQMSVDYSRPASQHFELGRKLRALRDQGLLIIGSGNVVHNLRVLNWNNPEAPPDDWAREFDAKIKELLEAGDYQSAFDYQAFDRGDAQAVPTPDHYFPMLYPLGLAFEDERVEFLYEGFDVGNISMRSFALGDITGVGKST